MSFITRMMDFAAGILVYLVLTSHQVKSHLQAKHRICSCVTIVIIAILVYMCCRGHVALRPMADHTASLMLRVGMLGAVKGLWCPLSVAWLLLHIMLQGDATARHMARFLSSSKWDVLADRSYSVFLLHPLVLVWVFQVVDVTVLIGPLNDFTTYIFLCMTTLVISLLAASIQDTVGFLIWKPLHSWAAAGPHLIKAA